VVQLDAGGAFQRTGLDQGRDAALQGSRPRRPRHHRQVVQLVAHGRKVLVAAKRGNGVGIGEFVGPADAMHDEQVFVAVPDARVPEDREEGRQSRAGGQQPQVAAALEAVGGEEAVARLLAVHRVANLQARQLRGELAAGHHDGIELEVLVVVGRGHRVGAPDDALARRVLRVVGVRLGHAQARELSRQEAKARVAGDAEGKEVGRPGVDPEDPFGGELVGHCVVGVTRSVACVHTALA
jgi:hypothetical protein